MVKYNSSLKETFVNSLRDRILSGKLKPGDRLPPERELAAKMGISRGSVNQGILDMERAGFLKVIPRKGTFVAQYINEATPQTMAAIMSYDSALIDPRLFRDLMDMRVLIELECVRLACKRMGHGQAEELELVTERLYRATAEELAGALYAYHLCLVRLSNNAAYSMIFQSFEKMLKNLFTAHYSTSFETDRCLPMYGRLTSYILLGDATGAEKQLAEILTVASDYLEIMLEDKKEKAQ